MWSGDPSSAFSPLRFSPPSSTQSTSPPPPPPHFCRLQKVYFEVTRCHYFAYFSIKSTKFAHLPFWAATAFLSLCRFNSTFLQKKFAFVRRQGSTLLVWFCLGAKPYMTTIHECKNNASFFLNLSTIQPNIVDYKRRKGFANCPLHTKTRAWKHAQVGQGLHKVSTDSSTAGSPTGCAP